MTHQRHQKELEASKVLFWGKDSTLVVFGAASTKLAWNFRIGYPYKEEYLAMLGTARLLPESGTASTIEVGGK
jgi:hypothetical protein